MEEHKIDLETYQLKAGSHEDRSAGMCAMEMVAYLANEPHSDAPQCTCPTLNNFVVRLNDGFTHEERQKLKPFLLRLIDTRDSNWKERSHFLAHAALTVFAPLALERFGFDTEAATMRGLEFGNWEANREAAQQAGRTTRDEYATAYTTTTLFRLLAAAYTANSAASAAAYAADVTTYACAAASSVDKTQAGRKAVVCAAMRVLDDCLTRWPGGSK